jgi:hypothetical protein
MANYVHILPSLWKRPYFMRVGWGGGMEGSAGLMSAAVQAGRVRHPLLRTFFPEHRVYSAHNTHNSGPTWRRGGGGQLHWVYQVHRPELVVTTTFLVTDTSICCSNYQFLGPCLLHILLFHQKLIFYPCWFVTMMSKVCFTLTQQQATARDVE